MPIFGKPTTGGKALEILARYTHPSSILLVEPRAYSFGETEDVNESANYIAPHQLMSPVAVIADSVPHPCNTGVMLTIFLSLEAVTAEDALRKEQ